MTYPISYNLASMKKYQKENRTPSKSMKLSPKYLEINKYLP